MRQEHGRELGRAIGGARTDGVPGAERTADRRLLVCFSGKIGSGKTSVSRGVASALGCRQTSFSAYLKAQMAERGGNPECRRGLQDLGQSRVEDDMESFCRDVLVAGGFVVGEDFVLDGVRHVGAIPYLIRIATPSEVRLIFLEAGADVRSARVERRSDSAGRDFERATSHVVEADMEADLPAAADAVFDGSLPLEETVRQGLRVIEEWRAAGGYLATSAGDHAGLDGNETK